MWWAGGIALICVLPSVLLGFGVDFSSGGDPLAPEAVGAMSPSELAETAHGMLRGSFTHTILEWTAVCAAAFVMILAFVHYRQTREPSLLVIGVALACAGAIDAFHTLAADRLIETAADHRDLIFFTWAVCRLFNATIMLIGVGLFTFSHGLRSARGGNVVVVAAGIGFVVAAYVIIHYCAASSVLPQTVFADAAIKRPYDLYTLLPYLICGTVVLPLYLKGHRTLFAYSLLWSMMPHVAAQLYMAFGSLKLHDSCFNIAHGLKAVGYLVPIIGLSLENIRTYRTLNRSSAALLKSESTMESVLATAVDGMITINGGGTILSFNKAAEKMFGYAESEVVGRNVNCLMPPPYTDEHDDYIANFLRTGDAKIIGIGREVVGLRKDGSTFPMDLAVSQVETEGEIIFAGIVRDVTERKQAEAELSNKHVAMLKSESMMRSILATAVDGVITINGRGTIFSFNRAAETMFGYAEAEVLGRNVNCLMPSPYAGEHDDYIANFLRTGDAKIIGIGREVVGLRKDGSTFPMDLAVSQVEIEGEIVFAGIVRDITERKLSEAELERRNAEMEQFVYTVSHDLKSPLVTLQGFSSHLQRDAREGRTDHFEDYIRRIHGATDRMKQLIDDLLDLSRVGRVVGETRPVRLTDLVEESRDRLDKQLAEQGITVHIQKDMPTIMGDEARLSQVFDNLLTNAIKYGCDAAEPRIDIGAKVIRERVRAFVRDNGQGIAPEYHDKIFGLFQRLDTDKTKGTGVGLSIVRRIVDVHGGRIWVESDPGGGAVFWIEFATGRGVSEPSESPILEKV